MHTSKLNPGVLVLAALATSCGDRNSASSRVHDTVLPSPAQPSQAVLGKGYNKEEERFAGECVAGTVEYAGAPEASVNFERSLSANETADSLGFAVGGKARYGAIEGSAAAKFATESASDDYSEATVYSAEYRFKNAKLKYAGLTDVGRTAQQGGGAFVWENWEKTCGHEFVEQIKLGARIMISAKVEFSTKEDKTAFAAEFKIKGPAFSASGELSKASRKFGKSASVSIRAYQLGGNVSRLSAIFGQGSDARVSTDGHQVHALLVCSMDRIDACAQVLNSALTYATDVSDAQAFPNQIRPDYDTSRADGPAELAYITKPWSDLAFYPPPALVVDAVKSARGDLSVLFEHWLKMRNRVNALVSGPFRLSMRQNENATKAQSVVADNIAEIYDAAMTCYTDVEKCVARVKVAKERLKPLDESLLEIFPEMFAQWCDALDSGVVRRSAKGTVSALMGIASREIDLQSVADKCGTAQGVLQDLSELDLTATGATNLLPLKTFVGLQKLKLARNGIADVTPLGGLTRLRDLNLNGNVIEDFSALTSLPELRTLQLAGNRIEALPALAGLGKLESLWLGDNGRLADLRPVAVLNGLRTLKVANNQISDLSPLAGLTALENLDISGNKVGDVGPLLGLRALRQLEMGGNPVGCPQALAPVCIGSM